MDRGREREWSSKPPVVYERSEEDERRFREEDGMRRPERYVRTGPVAGVGNRWRGAGDHYEPPSVVAKDPYYPVRDRGRERDWDWERDNERNRGHEPMPYSSPRRDARLPLRSPSKSMSLPSVSREPSPLSRSASPQSRHERQKHRLPTPRSTSVIASPQRYERERDYDWDRDRERDRGDRYEPYSREYYHNRDRDPRGQYYREEVDDWDRHYHPADMHIERERSRPSYSRSPVYRSTTPPRRTYNVIHTPDNLPPPPPSLPLPSQSDSVPSPVPVLEPSLAMEALRTRESVSLGVRRPGAPRETRSPPSMSLPPQKKTPAPTLRTKPTTPVSAVETSAPAIVVKKKRVPVKRTRDEEKAAYRRVFVGCGRRDDYDIMTKLGEGTFGEVHKALHRETRAPVALKRILMHNEKEGMPVTALREIKILKALRHPCIVDLLDMFVVPSKGKDTPMSVYMVFPYMDHDLAGLLENERVKLTPSQIKLYMKQLLEGTEYMHHNNILHRDMKAANLLIANSGALKIADFGLARAFGTTQVRDGRERRYTNCVVTRWYRPPELLLGARQYGGEIDIWGIGCVLGEMFMRRPILPGNSDLDQLDKIWAICGSPNQQNWPDYDTLPGCEGQIRFRPQERRIKTVYESLGKETCALLDRLLALDPRERITASEALDHEYFWSDPLPADPKSLPTYESSHEFDQRGRRHAQPAPIAPDLPRPAPGHGHVRPSHHGLPPPLHNRAQQAFRNQHPNQFQNPIPQNLPHQNFRNGAPPPYPPTGGPNGSNNVYPVAVPPPLPPLGPYQRQHQLQPPQGGPWSSGAPRPGPGGVGPWNSRPPYGGPPVGGGGDRRSDAPPPHHSQLPPRPAGLPPRPTGVPPPKGTRGPPGGGAYQSQERQPYARYGADSGGPPPGGESGGGSLNYG
ncbi:hypothetical protein M0805_002271 [Coniferiporia weirii]|nr:hypothetical protein M0805_002271 [Coniferiporia weirii]